jgi:hypothetical protein
MCFTQNAALLYSPMGVQRRWTAHPPPTPVAEGGAEDEVDAFQFNAAASVEREVAQQNATSQLDAVAASFLPPNPPASAVQKVREYLQKYPVDVLIVCSQVQITHVENDGQETRISGLSPCPAEEALAQAKERGMNLVQMTENGGIGYVRIRNEAVRISQLVAADLAAHDASGGGAASTASEKPTFRLKDVQVHVFRDAVDAHFIEWKSKKIVTDMRRKHPVKVAIQMFTSPDAAVSKLREMCNAIEREAEDSGVAHHYTGINTTDKELSITLTPTAVSDTAKIKDHIKHPTEKTWNEHCKRLAGIMQRTGRIGTYAKDTTLKPRNIGATLYRKDKYGRRID